MKYPNLTISQLESLHVEFAQYLAVQGIDHELWQNLKIEKPQSVADLISHFSDLVWEDILTRTEYAKLIKSGKILYFKFPKQPLEKDLKDTTIQAIILDLKESIVNVSDEQQLLSALSDNTVDLTIGKKRVESSKDEALVDALHDEILKILIQDALIITEEEYARLHRLVNL